MCHIFEMDEWVNENFDSVNLRDKRLNARLKGVVKKITEKPESSLPAQMGSWREVMGCYRLLNNPKVTHKRILSIHVEKTREKAAKSGDKVVLFIQDGSELETQPKTRGAGPIGNHTCQGILMHNCLAVEYDNRNPKVIGLANQRIWKRKDIVLHKNETRTQRNKRNRESDHWLKTLKNIGAPSGKTKWVSVGDRGNDIYEYFEGVKELNWDAVVRASQDRVIKVKDEQRSLMEWASSLAVGGTSTIKVRRKEDTKAKEIVMEISWGEVSICPPQRLGSKGKEINLWVVRCFNKEEDIEWVLYSTIPITTFEGAIEKINWYACRWIIEEYHKCLKTGCKIESNQFESTKPVEALLGVLSVVSILLLQMKYVARENDLTLAKEKVPNAVLIIICKRYELDKDMITATEFWRRIAMLGGFLGRKSDGDPGWQTVWRGWLRLSDMWIGAQALLGV